MFSIFLKDKRGVTLVELLVTLALLSLIFLMMFSLYIFGLTNFRSGAEQYDLQSEVRLALETLTDDVRYATIVEVFDKDESEDNYINIEEILEVDGGLYTNIDPFSTYIYYDEDQQSIVKLRRAARQDIFLQSEADDPLLFSSVSGSESALRYEVEGYNSREGRNFSVISEIIMLNNPSVSSGSGDVLRYLTPEAFVSQSQFPDVVLDGANDNEHLQLSFYDPDGNPRQVQYLYYETSPGANNHQLTDAHVAISPQNMLTHQFDITFEEIGNQPKNFVSGDEIFFVVEYGSDLEFEAAYLLVATGSGNNFKWELQ